MSPSNFVFIVLTFLNIINQCYTFPVDSYKDSRDGDSGNSIDNGKGKSYSKKSPIWCDLCLVSLPVSAVQNAVDVDTKLSCNTSLVDFAMHWAIFVSRVKVQLLSLALYTGFPKRGAKPLQWSSVLFQELCLELHWIKNILSLKSGVQWMTPSV